MRLSFAVPALAGFLLGWAALAHADAPPAAPIFYCPTPGKAAPAATAAAPVGHGGRVVRAAEHRRCPTLRVAAEHHRWRGHEHGQRVLASDDVSASQAFIYRYERAHVGFDPREAEEAWAEGRHHPGDRRHDGPPMEGPVLAQREIAPPPCPHHCPGPDGWRHDDHVYAEQAPRPPITPPLPEPAPPPRLAYQRPMPPPLPAPAPPPVHAYAWQDGHSGYGYEQRGEESERAGGWSYSEQDGHGHFHHWGDHFQGEPEWNGHDDSDRHDADHHGGDHHWAQQRYRCPPPVPASACSAGPDAPIRHSDVAVAGRDAAGYLTWPGKTE